MAYESIEPQGETRADWRNALLCTVIANSNPFRDKKSPVHKLTDFIIRFWDEVYDGDRTFTSTGDVKAKAKAAAEAMRRYVLSQGGTIIDPHGSNNKRSETGI